MHPERERGGGERKRDRERGEEGREGERERERERESCIHILEESNIVCININIYFFSNIFHRQLTFFAVL